MWGFPISDTHSPGNVLLRVGGVQKKEGGLAGFNILAAVGPQHLQPPPSLRHALWPEMGRGAGEGLLCLAGISALKKAAPALVKTDSAW